MDDKSNVRDFKRANEKFSWEAREWSAETMKFEQT